ncbi:MAG: PEGA domain-containing protein, partial [Myxococcales bacterium]|nr:PEGA domain-containing protein [Myxococcales bacterium]
DPDVFPPDVVQRFESVRPRGHADARINVLSDPPGALVHVDSIARGYTPLMVEGLVAGTHLVRLTRPGSAPYTQEAEASSRGTEINAFLVDGATTEGLSEAVLAARDVDLTRIEEGGPLAEIATILDLDRLGVIRVGAGVTGAEAHLSFYFYDTSDGALVAENQQDIPSAPGQLEAAIRGLMGPALQEATRPRATPPPPPPPPSIVEPEPDDPLWEKWWFWTAVGGAVVLTTIVGIAVASSGDELSNDPDGQIVFEF